MSWLPGVGPVKDISAIGVSRGLSEDWYSDKSSKREIKKGNFWDIIDNPLYQVAAEAKGYNWEEWINDAKGKVGYGPGDWVRAEVKPGGSRSMSGGPNAGILTATTQAEYEWMSKEDAEDRGLSYTKGETSRWRNTETGEIISGNPNTNKGIRGAIGAMAGPYGSIAMNLPEFGGRPSASSMSNLFGGKGAGEWEEIRDWGVHDSGVSEDLDEINGWLLDIVNVNKDIPKIIREGPKGKHYGIEGDIWEYYGLDKEPEPPKKLEWDSAEKNMQLATAVTSDVGYSTPEGITPVDLHGD